MSIVENIFNKMTELNMTQKELSRRSHIPESTISDWKKKGNTPSADRLADIAKALGMSVSELFDATDKVSCDTDYFITDEEKIIIEYFRSASYDERTRIVHYCRGLSNNTIAKKNSDNAHLSVASDTQLALQKNLALKIRRLARLDRIRLDENMHTSGYNLHFIKYLDYVGLDRLEYIKKYLSNLQPFMITEIKSQERFEGAVCILDEFYRISLYIKLDATRNEEVIVSFHENNKNGIARRNSIIKNNRYVYVFAEAIGSYIESFDSYTINLFITRGVSTFPINVPATRYDEEGFMVNYIYINNALIDIANRYLEDLYTSDLNFESIEIFSSLQQLSFTSYGNDSFSNISLLIDSILIQSDYISKQIADSALCIYCSSLKLIDSDRKRLLDTLKERFKVNSVKALPQIMERVEMNI